MAAIEDALWENGGELTPELEEALTETSTSLIVKTDGYGALIRKFDSAAASIDAEIKRLQALKKTASNATERLKDRLKYSMQTNGLSKLEGSLTKISLRRSERVVVDEESILAPYYFTIDVIRETLPSYVKLGDLKIDKTVIKDMIKKDGIIMPDAHMEENWSVVMR